MRIGGPRSLFSDPAILALLALHAGKDAADVYKAYDAKHSQDMLAQAYLTGQPVTSEPGGPFRQIASKLTGGWVNPDVRASGSDLMNQSIMLSNLNNAKLGALEHAASARKTLGPASFESGGPFSTMLARSGVNTDLSGPLPSEIHQQKRDEAAAQRAKNETPEAKTAAAVQKEQALAPIKLEEKKKEETAAGNIRLGLAGPIAAASATAKLGVETSPLGLSAARAKATATAEGSGVGKNVVLDNTSLRNIKDKVVYDSNGKNITASNPNLKWKDAFTGDNMSVKPGSKEEAALKSIPKNINDLSEMEKMVTDPKNRDIFPLAGTTGALLAKGKSNWRNRKSDPRLNQFYSYMDDFINNVRIANGGRALSSEINAGTAFWPDPGTGNSSRNRGILASVLDDTGLDAGPADTAQEMLNKIKKLKSSSRSIARATASEGITSEDDDSAADEALDSWHSTH